MQLSSTTCPQEDVKFDRDGHREKLMEQLLEARQRSPGEPYRNLILSNDGKLTPTDQCPELVHISFLT